MDKRQQRTQRKRESIKQTAREMFVTYGVDKVSMDEIAAQANVSKVTIYKYFGSKDELYAEVVNLFIDETLAATEAILNSDMDYLDKHKAVLQLQADSSSLVSFDYLFQVWENDKQTAAHLQENIQNRVKTLMYKFYEEGKRKGYIDEHISFDILFLYADIFRAGLQAKLGDVDSGLVDKETLEKLYDLYFFGILKRK